jgi:hypothetical protein
MIFYSLTSLSLVRVHCFRWRETQMFLIKFSGSFDFLKTLLGTNRRAFSEDVLASVHGI